MSESVEIVETLRDAFQGLPKLIPTSEKLSYTRALLDAGFTHIDLGSLGLDDELPQFADTPDLVQALRTRSHIERIVIVMSDRGLEQAFSMGGLDGVGFPYSLSPQFQLRYAKATATQTWPLIEKIIARVEQHDMSFILYLSMAFGNPYNESWNVEELFTLIRSLCSVGVRHICLADTAAMAQPEQVRRVFLRAKAEQPSIRFSAHFHGRPDNWYDCVQAALDAGCRRFDTALGGLGGCPAVSDTLIANIPSEKLVLKLEKAGLKTGIDPAKAAACAAMAREFQKRYG
jgi:hydroxymethylglutaryl-CoA lyase